MKFIVNARDRFGNSRDEGGPQLKVRAIGNQIWAYSNVAGTVPMILVVSTQAPILFMSLCIIVCIFLRMAFLLIMHWPAA